MDARGRAWRASSCAVSSILLAGLGACTFDPLGTGASSGAQPDQASSGAAEPETTAETGSAEAEGDTTAGPASGADDAASSGPGDDGLDGDETTAGPPGECDGAPPFTLEIDATQALLAAPMQLGASAEEGIYAYSEVADDGRASFQFVLPCPAEVRAWARVYDPAVGANGLEPGPDSFFVSIDAEDPVEWWYGCQMLDAAPYGAAWSWEPLMDNAYCGADEYRRTLSPGTHLLHLANREAGDHAMSRVAAVARVVVTTDPAYAPPS